jgi:hypothetical protein
MSSPAVMDNRVVTSSTKRRRKSGGTAQKPVILCTGNIWVVFLIVRLSVTLTIY